MEKAASVASVDTRATFVGLEEHGDVAVMTLCPLGGQDAMPGSFPVPRVRL
jgi:hypothetical protein